MENILWNLFMNTGDIRYYLQYKGMNEVLKDEWVQQGQYEIKEAVLR